MWCWSERGAWWAMWWRRRCRRRRKQRCSPCCWSLDQSPDASEETNKRPLIQGIVKHSFDESVFEHAQITPACLSTQQTNRTSRFRSTLDAFPFRPIRRWDLTSLADAHAAAVAAPGGTAAPRQAPSLTVQSQPVWTPWRTAVCCYWALWTIHHRLRVLPRQWKAHRHWQRRQREAVAF
jgi:hypothetical protein